VEGTAGLDKVQVNFSEGVYSAQGQADALDPSDFVLTDLDNNREIIAVEHYPGTASAILTVDPDLDRDSDVGVDTLAAASNEIFNKSNDAVRTTPVTMVGNECPPGGFRLDFNEPAGNATVEDNTGLVVGNVYNYDYSILGDGYFTGDVQEQVQTYIVFNQNTRCFKTPRAYTVETRVYLGDVDMDYKDEYPLNDVDDDYDIGGATYVVPYDGRNATNTTMFYRDSGSYTYFYTSKNNWGGDWGVDQKDKTKLMLRHSTKDQIICDGTFPGDTWVGSPGTDEEWVSDRYTYPIVSGHWYTLRAVFNTDKGYTSFDFFARDEGTDGAGTGANWSGYINITNEPSQNTVNCAWNTNPGSELREVDAPFLIGDDLIHDKFTDRKKLEDVWYDWPIGPDSPGHWYTPWIRGKMDWLSFKPIADYTGVEGGPWRGNTAPVADAGTDQGVTTGSLVTLDGTGSSDGDGDTLEYSWSITSKPATSTAALSDPTIVNPTFTADLGGTYTIELTVNDGTIGSAVDSVTVTASP
jgi:hypothetical protein